MNKMSCATARELKFGYVNGNSHDYKCSNFQLNRTNSFGQKRPVRIFMKHSVDSISIFIIVIMQL